MPASENITLGIGVLGILSTPETNDTTDHVLVWSEENNEVQKVSKASISGEGTPQNLQQVLEQGSEAVVNSEFSVIATNFELNAGAGGQITSNQEEGVTIQGNAGGVKLAGSNLGVGIFGNGGGVNIVGGTVGINIQPDAGFKYTIDDSANYTERSIPDVEWVQTEIAASGGGSVQSVTGTLVNDTDPANPVINIPVLEQVLDANNTANNVPIVLQDSPAANETATFEYYRFSLNGEGKEAIFQPNQYTITDSLTNKSISATTDGLRVSTNGTGYGTNIANDNLNGEDEQSIQLPNVGETERTFAVGVSSGGVTSYSGNDGIIEIPSAVATNLGYTASGTNGVITNSNGAGVTIPAADGTNAGLLLPGDKNKLNNVPANTTSDLAGKQATLVSGTNIKTYGGRSLLGSGDIYTTETGYSYYSNGVESWVNGNAAQILRGNGTLVGISDAVAGAQVTIYSIATSDATISSTTTVRTAFGILDYRTSMMNAISSKTANYTLTTSDFVVELTANTATFTLPTAVGNTGKEYVLKNSGTGVLTVAAQSGQLIDGTNTKTFTNQYMGIRVKSNGTRWLIIGAF